MDIPRTMAWRKFLFRPMDIGYINSWYNAYRWAYDQITMIPHCNQHLSPFRYYRIVPGQIIVITRSYLYDSYRRTKQDPLGLGIERALEKFGPRGHQIVLLRGQVVTVMEKILVRKTRLSYSEAMANLAEFRDYCARQHQDSQKEKRVKGNQRFRASP